MRGGSHLSEEGQALRRGGQPLSLLLALACGAQGVAWGGGERPHVGVVP